jgi:YHS domain-containing protein
MSIDDVLVTQIDGSGETCAVCGKSVAGASGHVRLKYGESMVALCCPLCLQTFHKNPSDYLRRLKTRTEVQAILDLLSPKPVATHPPDASVNRES